IECDRRMTVRIVCAAILNQQRPAFTLISLSLAPIAGVVEKLSAGARVADAARARSARADRARPRQCGHRRYAESQRQNRCNHVTSILSKLGVAHRPAAIVLAREA